MYEEHPARPASQVTSSSNNNVSIMRKSIYINGKAKRHIHNIKKCHNFQMAHEICHWRTQAVVNDANKYEAKKQQGIFLDSFACTNKQRMKNIFTFCFYFYLKKSEMKIKMMKRRELRRM